MLIILYPFLLLSCDRSTCDSKTLSELADARCQYWSACPEYAPFIFESYDDHEACVEAITRFETDTCHWATEAPCNGELNLAKAEDCAAANLGSIESCQMVPWCAHVDSGVEDDGMYQNVTPACKSEPTE